MKKTDDREVLECVEALVNYCSAHPECQDCVLRLREPYCWECNIKSVDMLDMAEIKANVYAAGKDHFREATEMAEGTTKAPEAGNRFMAYVLLISLALLAVILGTLAWSTYDRLGYVRFVLSLPLPGWLKMFLYGWY